MVTMDSRKTQMMSIQKQEKAQTRRRMFFKGSTLLKQDTSQLYWSRKPPKVAQARRQNIIVRLPGCVDEAKNANAPHAFALFISDDILNIILTHTNQKIS
jgi:hypothetical protein